MEKRRVTATKQISTVIDVLQLGKKTGILTVERGENETFEEGTVIFVNGQVVQVSVGSYTGRDASTKLFSWQECRFSFVPMPTEQVMRGLSTGQVDSSKGVSGNRQEPFYGQQTYPETKNDLDRRPLVAIYYKGTMNEILHLLDQQSFSRAHRHLFLLIDGRRSIRELATFIGRTPKETTALLVDLELAGLIKL